MSAVDPALGKGGLVFSTADMANCKDQGAFHRACNLKDATAPNRDVGCDNNTGDIGIQHGHYSIITFPLLSYIVMTVTLK